ncbi:hypothetical protein EW146_g10506 [Bondarzewia mesenterica]|uniref:Uncharacterized protein n=1 Tax=Bondarzewia mesenterica TaxID=1095465 RepID=A0A4S4KWA7_9AGAM|nr:hypothetical protein EW146_g10506 [Bondarzewia mesenterica]
MCLDELINYLDRESLAAPIEALKVFEGGCSSSPTTVTSQSRSARRCGRCATVVLRFPGTTGSRVRAQGPALTRRTARRRTSTTLWVKVDNMKQKKIVSSEARKLKTERMARRREAKMSVTTSSDL